MVVPYLPLEDNSSKLAVGMAIGQVVTTLINFATRTTFWKGAFQRNKNYVAICDREDGPDKEKNPIYSKLEEYIIDKYMDEIKKCDLIAAKGEISFSLKNCTMKRPLYDVFNDHDITLRINQTKLKESTSDKETSDKLRSTTNIIVESTTASVSELREYVDSISKLQKEHRNVLTIYRHTSRDDEKSMSRWDTIKVKTNKTMENTIVSDDVHVDVFDDIEWFINNESWYAKKGIDYKRGYILYGVPGTGKTSIIKAIATKYGLPIFSLDLSSIKNNNDLVRLTNKITYEAKSSHYILAMEDVDQSKLFAPRRYDDRSRGISMNCFLNCIDGVVETHGRITIMTANNVDALKRHKALVRPGRIDKSVEIGCCDKDQIQRLVENFYEQPADLSEIKTKNKITPAQLIKFMQSTPNDINETLEFIDDTSTKKYEDYQSEVKKRMRRYKRLTPLDRKKKKVSDEKSAFKRLQADITRAENRIEKCKLMMGKKQLDIEHAEKLYQEMKEKDDAKKKAAAEKKKAAAEKKKASEEKKKAAAAKKKTAADKKKLMQIKKGAEIAKKKATIP